MCYHKSIEAVFITAYGMRRGDVGLIAVFRRFSLPAQIGLIGGLIGGLVGMIVAIIANPLFGIIFSGIVIAVIYFSFRVAFGSIIRQEALMKNGVQAEATIVEVKETGMTVNEIYPLVKLVLEVRPPEGQPFRVETKELINRFEIPTFQPGAVLPVLYDPRNPKKVAVGTKESLDSGRGQTQLPAAGALEPEMMRVVQDFIGNQDPEKMRTAQDPIENLDPEKMRMTGEFLAQENEKSAEIRATGKPARAKILVATPLGINVNGNNPAMTFMLEVHPEGEPAFQAQTTGIISEASVPKFQPGGEIFVKYDPNDKTRVSLDHS